MVPQIEKVDSYSGVRNTLAPATVAQPIRCFECWARHGKQARVKRSLGNETKASLLTLLE